MIGARLRDRRIELGLETRELAARAQMSEHHLRDIEVGRRQLSWRPAVLLTDLLRLPAAEWVDLYLSEESRLLPLIRIAEHLVHHGELDQAAAVQKRLRTLSRGERRYRGRIYHLNGLLAYRQGRYARSFHWFRLAERAATKSLDPVRRADGVYDAALAMMRIGLLSQSAAKFDQAARMFQALGNPQKAGYSHLTKANVLMEMLSFREALSVYRTAARALRGDPWHFDCKLGEAICLWRTRSPESALKLLLNVKDSARDPDRRAKYHHNVGVIYRQIGKVEEAIRHLERALEVSAPDASHPSVFCEMCLCRALVGDFTGAVQMLNEFNALAGAKDPHDVLAMAVLSYMLGHGPIVETLPRHVIDGYEQRLTAAISLLRS